MLFHQTTNILHFHWCHGLTVSLFPSCFPSRTQIYYTPIDAMVSQFFMFSHQNTSPISLLPHTCHTPSLFYPAWFNYRNKFPLSSSFGKHAHCMLIFVIEGQTRICTHTEQRVSEMILSYQIKNYFFCDMFVLFCFSWRYNPLWLYFQSPVTGFSLLILEVSWSHTTTRHSR